MGRAQVLENLRCFTQRSQRAAPRRGGLRGSLRSHSSLPGEHKAHRCGSILILCRRPVTETAVELANKLYFRVEARPPEEQIATRKAWFVDRRSQLVLDDIWENDLIALARSTGLMAVQIAPTSTAVDFVAFTLADASRSGIFLNARACSLTTVALG